jgi:hypothetical protein
MAHVYKKESTMKRLLIALALIGGTCQMVVGFAPQSDYSSLVNPKMTPAYELLVLRKVNVETELIDLSSQFTSESRQVRTKVFELSVLNREMKRMHRTEREQVPKLSLTYGNLLLRKVDLEVQLNIMRGSFTSEHPAVNRKTAEISFLTSEIEMLLK